MREGSLPPVSACVRFMGTHDGACVVVSEESHHNEASQAPRMPRAAGAEGCRAPK